jgi:hypothetical protein
MPVLHKAVTVGSKLLQTGCQFNHNVYDTQNTNILSFTFPWSFVSQR